MRLEGHDVCEGTAGHKVKPGIVKLQRRAKHFTILSDPNSATTHRKDGINLSEKIRAVSD